MREHLVGYLLGALDSPESDALENHLARDRRLQEDLELLRGGLEPLDADRDHIEPPAGLAAKTCRFVHDCSQALAVSPTETEMSAVPMRSGWRLTDFAMAASVLIAAGLLFLPALNNSRSNAQLNDCKNNLQNLGVALAQYSGQHGDYFPQIPLKGKLAAAGFYAPKLLDDGYLSDRHTVVCPSSQLAADRHFVPPSQKDVLAAKGKQLAELRRTMGGSYGYTLGYMKDGQYQPTRNHNREHYAIMADAPSDTLKDFQSANHGGCGQNVLMEDGHVKYLKTCQLSDNNTDEIFCNNDGDMAPGVDENDAVIGHSAVTSEYWPVVAEKH